MEVKLMTFEKKPINEIKRPMNNDYLEVENADGMPGLVDSTIALDFLLGIKSGIRNGTIAISETATPELRATLSNLIDNQIDLYADVTELMLKKGWLHPYNLNEQFQLDYISSKTALQIAKLDLFPDDTSRLGTFATPKY
jgi:similar to spore coat protein